MRGTWHCGELRFWPAPTTSAPGADKSVSLWPNDPEFPAITDEPDQATRPVLSYWQPLKRS